MLRYAVSQIANLGFTHWRVLCTTVAISSYSGRRFWVLKSLVVGFQAIHATLIRLHDTRH